MIYLVEDDKSIRELLVIIRDFRQTDLKNRVNFTESLGQMMQISLSLI